MRDTWICRSRLETRREHSSVNSTTGAARKAGYNMYGLSVGRRMAGRSALLHVCRELATSV